MAVFHPSGQTRILSVFATKIETYMPEFQKELVYSICPGPSTTTNNVRKSSGEGWVLYSVSPFIPKLG